MKPPLPLFLNKRRDFFPLVLPCSTNKSLFVPPSPLTHDTHCPFLVRWVLTHPVPKSHQVGMQDTGLNPGATGIKLDEVDRQRIRQMIQELDSFLPPTLTLQHTHPRKHQITMERLVLWSVKSTEIFLICLSELNTGHCVISDKQWLVNTPSVY